MGTSFDIEELPAVEVCFAQASRLLYCEPDNDEIASQACEQVFASAPYGMDDERVQRGLDLMDSWLVELDSDVDRRAFDEQVAALKREWFRLFIGAGTPDAPCWESYYREPNSHLFGKRTLEVRELYRRHGLQIERLHSEPDDHLGLMLGFMSRLAGEEAEAAAEGDGDAASEAALEQDAFLADHILPWLAVWRYSVMQHAASDYFRGVGEFVFGLCACYAQRFGIVFDEEVQTFKRVSG